MFTEAVASVLQDEGFQVESLHSQTALKTARFLSEWCKDEKNKPKLHNFSHILVTRLKACFASKHKTFQLKRERMWGAYHRLRSSETFHKDWKDFVDESVGLKGYPVLYQFVTHIIFKKLIKAQYPLSDSTAESPDRPLTYQEQNALRYVSGYVIHKLRHRFEKSHHPKKTDMILFLFEFAGDELCGNTEEWINSIDRGGLQHVNDLTYNLFVTIEEEIRRLLTLGCNKEDFKKETTTKAVFESNDVLFTWCLLSAGISDDIATVVLHEIVELYVTIRGFAFVTSCLELYKQEHKKTLQKKRALRSQLCTKSHDQ